MKHADTSVLYQHGTLALLVPGLFDGTQTVGELLEHGNYGIGTASGIDGEMIILNGVPYLAKADGSVSVVTNDVTTPFANVHFDAPSSSFTLSDVDMKTLGSVILANRPLENVFFAVRIEGKFKRVKARAAGKQTKPYPTLGAVAANQAIFTRDNIEGSVVGYFSPELYAGMAAPGYHLHFLDKDKTMGGHLLNFTLDEATVYLQPFASVNTHLPIENEDFLNTHFDLSSMKEEIEGAENE